VPQPVVRLHDPSWRDFTSDNCAGVHPEMMAAMAEANLGHQPSYGADVYTHRLRDVIRQQFGTQALAFPVFNGTGANIVALQAMCSRWEAVVCAESAHLQTSESAAPEHHGIKLITLPELHGRIDAADLAAVMRFGASRHHAQPGVLSISQSTELGTCYTPDDLKEITTAAHRHGLRVHVDGARLANAAATLGVSLRAITTDVGIDVLSFGATKNGGMFGDCIVVLDPEAVRGLPFLKKATTQLPSKARFVSAQVLALLADDLWLRNASAANAMATRLSDGIASVRGLRVVHPVEANTVFVELPDAVSSKLRQRYSFNTWDDARGVVRLMTAFDTEAGDVDAFVAALAEAAEGSLPPGAPGDVGAAHADRGAPNLA
jgi:threonine aldolase